MPFFYVWHTGLGKIDTHLGVDVFSTATWAKTASFRAIQNADFVRGKFSPDDSSIVVSFNDLQGVDLHPFKVEQALKLDIFSSRTAKLERSVIGPVAFPTELALSRNGHYASIASLSAFSNSYSIPQPSYPSVFIYDLDTMSLLQTYSSTAALTNGVTWSNSADVLASVGSNGKMWLWDAKSDKALDEYSINGGVSLAFSPDGSTLAYSNGSRVIIRRLQAGK